jgi:hypothetical protein
MSITVLNITANNLKALELRGAALLKKDAPLTPGAIKNGLILQPETLGREIKALFRQGNLSSGRVICSISGLPFTYRLLTLPSMGKEAFHEAVLRKTREEMSISPDEMYLSWQTYPASNGEYQVLVTGITRRPVDNLIKALQVAGIGPYILDLPHLALARLSPYPDAVIVDLEKDCSNIVLVADGMPRGMQLAPDIALGASLSDRIGQVMEKASRMIEFYNNSHHTAPLKDPVKLLVTGELLDEEKAMEYVRPPVGCTLERLTSTKPSFSGKSIGGIAVNAGMLELPLDRKVTALSRYLDMSSIIRDSRPKSDVRGVLKKIAVPALVVGGVALLALSYVSLNNYRAELSRAQDDLANANMVLEQKKTAAGEAGLLKLQIDELLARAGEIENGKSAIFAPREYVAEVASVIKCLPGNVTVNTLEVDSIEFALSGSAAAPDPVILFADNLEKTGGFTQAIITWIDRPHGTGDNTQLYFKLPITR